MGAFGAAVTKKRTTYLSIWKTGKPHNRALQRTITKKATKTINYKSKCAQHYGLLHYMSEEQSTPAETRLVQLVEFVRETNATATTFTGKVGGSLGGVFAELRRLHSNSDTVAPRRRTSAARRRDARSLQESKR